MASPDAGEVSLLARLTQRDHTRESLLGSLVVLSVPSILMSVLGFASFQLVELRFLALLGDDAIAAAGSTNQTLRQILLLLMMGMSVSTQMMVARLIGEGRGDAADHVAGQSLVLGALLWLGAIATVGLFPETFARPFAAPEVLPIAALYIRVVFLTVGVMVASQLFNAILNGAGDATTPMVVTLCALPVSIAAEWAFAFGRLGMPALGIQGIAVGAAVGGATALAASLWVLFSGRARVHLRARHVVPDPAVLRAMLRFMWQPAGHMAARQLMVVFFMTLAAAMGGEVQTAYTIGMRVEWLPAMLVFPIANACATLVGQNLGAGDPARAWRSIWLATAAAFALLWPAAIALVLFREQIAGAFTDDPEVLAMAAEYMLFNAAAISFYGLYFIAFRTLQAAGDMLPPMVISLSCAVGVGAPLGFALSRTELGETGMWIANLVYTATNTALTTAWLLRGRWARRASAVGPTPAAASPP